MSVVEPAQSVEIVGDSRCLHCKSPVPPDAKDARFCCSGCEAVHNLLREGGLEKYYALAPPTLAPATVPSTKSHTWLEPLMAAVQEKNEPICTLDLDVQGVHCAACVWLMNETFRRDARGGGDVVVNPTLGTVKLRWVPGGFDPDKWISEVERFGYQFGPARKEARRPSIDLPLRLGVSAALTINVMLFSVSFHFGLSRDDADVFRLFTWLTFALSSVTVVVGGWPFLRAGWLSLRSGLLHLDLPIALGIVLVYAMSIVQLVATGGRGDLAYFDTLNTFITLMLLGRFIQERILLRNRRFLLEDDGAEGLWVRVIHGGRVEIVRAPKVVSGDHLLIAAGDVVPVDAELLDEGARVSSDWINGEAAPRQVGRGQVLPAGSFNAGQAALRALAKQDFKDSLLVSLLRAPPERKGTHGSKHQQLWNQVARRWVVTVLGVSALGFVLWLPRGFDQALNVAVSLLVITCPCAVGIAIPLAYELVLSRLRRVGFYSRSSDLLDRLTDVQRVVFDKTGTLTLGKLELVDPTQLATLTPAVRDVVFNLAVRSSHPVSAAIVRALESFGPTWDESAQVVELGGRGMEWARADGTWRLGRASWASGEGGAGTVLSLNGVTVADLRTREVMRVDAKAELARLAAQGYGLHLLSGDSAARTSALAAELGIPPGHAHGQLSPEQKGERLRVLGPDETLFVGDGVNDSIAFATALAAGTPAIDRPVMPGRSDFFLVGEGLTPLSVALDGAAELRAVVKRILALSLAYNVLAIGASLLGLMSPVAAAISMPASTLSLLAFTLWSLGRASKRGSATVTSSAVLNPHPA
ncbi:MAG: heavy metal translocating P-type ATPase metal-binding domain-containing protein [Myxococcaceae bacterium]